MTINDIILRDNEGSGDGKPTCIPTPVEDLWFYDGNLILQAENSLFKIYSGLLSARSSVFKDMFGFPPPAEGNPMMDGCTIIKVYDSAKDMTYFLRAVFDSGYFEAPPVPTELAIVESILRLSLKYDVQYLRRRSLQHLLSTFPTKLDGWRQRDTMRTIPPIENTPFAAYHVAREFDLTWLLPSILYCVCSHPFEKTLDFATWGGGGDDDEQKEVGMDQQQQQQQLEFDWPQKRICIVGRTRLVMMQYRNAMALTKTALHPIDGCSGRSCSAMKENIAELLAGLDVVGFLDFFEDNEFSDLCALCQPEVKEFFGMASQAMWDELPGMFGLPGWESLEDIRLKSLE